MDQVVNIGGIQKTYANPHPYVRLSVDKDGFRAYSDGEDAMMREFREDLAEEYGVVGHPKESLLFSKAWARGHSDGFYAVAYAYADLVELIS